MWKKIRYVKKLNLSLFTYKFLLISASEKSVSSWPETKLKYCTRANAVDVVFSRFISYHNLVNYKDDANIF